MFAAGTEVPHQSIPKGWGYGGGVIIQDRYETVFTITIILMVVMRAVATTVVGVCPQVPEPFLEAHAFIGAGKENREFMAYQAYRGRMEWPYRIPLESVVGYLKWKGRPT